MNKTIISFLFFFISRNVHSGWERASRRWLKRKPRQQNDVCVCICECGHICVCDKFFFQLIIILLIINCYMFRLLVGMIDLLSLTTSCEMCCISSLTFSWDDMTYTWPQGAVDTGFYRLASLSLLLGAWGTPLGECRRAQNILYLPCMCFDLCKARSIQWPCGIFLHGGLSDRYHQNFRFMSYRSFGQI